MPKNMKLYSLLRRPERYRIIYVWRILENIVPNINENIKQKKIPIWDNFGWQLFGYSIFKPYRGIEKLSKGSLKANFRQGAL